jgi:hypothetical protein
MENQNEVVEVVEAAKKKVTKEERLEQLRSLLEKEMERHAAKVAYYEDLIATWEAKGDKKGGLSFQEGDVVTFTYGRPGHVQVEKTGTVIGFKDTGKAGIFVVVECGEGADKEIIRVRPSAVTGVEPTGATAPEVESDGNVYL